MKFSIKDFFRKCVHIRADLVTFTEEILNGKLRFLCSVTFVKVTMKMKLFKCQKTITQAIKKVTWKFETFFLVKIIVMDVSLRSSQLEVFYENTVKFRK